MTHDESFAKAVESIKARYGKLDVLVHNAAMAILPKLDDTPSIARANFA